MYLWLAGYWIVEVILFKSTYLFPGKFSFGSAWLAQSPTTPFLLWQKLYDNIGVNCYLQWQLNLEHCVFIGFDLTKSTFKSLNCTLRLGWSSLTLPCHFYSRVTSCFKKQIYLKNNLGRKREFSVVSLISHICAGIIEGQIWQIWVDSHSHETAPQEIQQTPLHPLYFWGSI